MITATYNRAALLPRSLDSLISQTYSDWECILVDDGSTDNTAEVIARYQDPRIHVYTHPANRGVTAAHNTGLDNIHGEWFTLLASDDELVPEALATAIETAERVGADSVLANCADAVTGEWTGIGLTQDGFVSRRQEGALRGDYWGITRTKLLGDVRFNEHLRGEEQTVWLRIYYDARRYYVHKALRLYHREGADQVTKRPFTLRQKMDQFLVIDAEEKEFLARLREMDPPGYRRMMSRIWTSKVLNPFVPRG